MNSRQFIWLLLFSIALNLNCFATHTFEDTSLASKKVFILLRSEENGIHIKKFKDRINNDLAFQNVSVQIKTYKRSEPLPQAKIFKLAYSGGYDVILLIDQVAKYNIDNRVTNTMIKMGSKYKIRSYNLKESPYIWKDHGDSNCNISVDLSLQQFTKKILVSIDIVPTQSVHNTNSEVLLASNNGDYEEQLALYNTLIMELNEQKRKTRKTLYDIEMIKIKLQDKVVLRKN